MSEFESENDSSDEEIAPYQTCEEFGINKKHLEKLK